MDFVVTGTRAYGPVSEDSDIDIVMYKEDSQILSLFLESKGIETYRTKSQDAYADDGGYYFDLVELKVNIIVVTCPTQMDYWRDRVEYMRNIKPISDREKRISVFNDEDDIPF